MPTPADDPDPLLPAAEEALTEPQDGAAAGNGQSLIGSLADAAGAVSDVADGVGSVVD